MIKPSMEGIKSRIKGAWAFFLAASTAPIAFVASGPCASTGCAACPLGGACTISLPIVFSGIMIMKYKDPLRTRLRSTLDRLPKRKKV